MHDVFIAEIYVYIYTWGYLLAADCMALYLHSRQQIMENARGRYDLLQPFKVIQGHLQPKALLVL